MDFGELNTWTRNLERWVYDILLYAIKYIGICAYNFIRNDFNLVNYNWTVGFSVHIHTVFEWFLQIEPCYVWVNEFIMLYIFRDARSCHILLFRRHFSVIKINENSIESHGHIHTHFAKRFIGRTSDRAHMFSNTHTFRISYGNTCQRKQEYTRNINRRKDQCEKDEKEFANFSIYFELEPPFLYSTVEPHNIYTFFYYSNSS